VNGGAAAARVVVVHRRQVVVDEAVGVDAFEGRARRDGGGRRGIEKTRRFDEEERPEALAGPERRIAHRLDQPRRTRGFPDLGGRRQEPVERGVGGPRRLLQSCLERRHRPRGMRQNRAPVKRRDCAGRRGRLSVGT